GWYSACLAAPPSAAARSAGPCAPVAPRATADSPPLRLWARVVDHESAIPEEPTVQHLDCLAGLFLRSHLHEPESARPARELVRDDPNRLHGARLLEQLAQILLRGLEREVSDEQLSGHR